MIIMFKTRDGKNKNNDQICWSVFIKKIIQFWKYLDLRFKFQCSIYFILFLFLFILSAANRVSPNYIHTVVSDGSEQTSNKNYLKKSKLKINFLIIAQDPTFDNEELPNYCLAY